MITRSKSTSAGDNSHINQTAAEVTEENFESFDTSVGSHNAIYAQSSAKDFLIELNNRLAIYIDKVRDLENKNAALLVKVREFELVEARKRDLDHTDYKQVNYDLRRQLENTNALLSRSEMEKSRVDNEYAELNTQLEKIEDRLTGVIEDRDKLQQRLSSTRGKLESAEARLTEAEKKSALLKEDLLRYLKENSELKSVLEAESMLRAELQGRIETELKTYDDLLQGEEKRLNLTGSEVSHQSSSRSLNVSLTEPNVRPVSLGSRVNPKSGARGGGTRKRRHSVLREERFYDFSDNVDEDPNRSWLGRLFNY